MKIITLKKEWILLILSIILYGINKIYISKLGIDFFCCYFNDLLAGIVFFCVLSLINCFWLKKRISIITQFSFLCIAGVFWEYITPLYNSSSVSDPKDIVFYISGGFLFCMVTNNNSFSGFR